MRPETPCDEESIYDVNRQAFGSEEESRLVNRLRKAASPNVSLVAVVGQKVVGHIFFSPVKVEHGSSDLICMGLGPMAVVPDLQNCGIGSGLVRMGLSKCRDLQAAAVFVLGHPDYYPRFGFRNAAQLGFRYRNQRYDPYFFVLELSRGFIGTAGGVVTYHPAFDNF
ncbi:MAG TPA: N-acetyltransferase [Rhodothermia bacterium]